MDIKEICPALEAILFAAGEPVPAEKKAAEGGKQLPVPVLGLAPAEVMVGKVLL